MTGAETIELWGEDLQEEVLDNAQLTGFGAVCSVSLGILISTFCVASAGPVCGEALDC